MNYAALQAEWKACAMIARQAVSVRSSLGNHALTWTSLGLALLAPVLMLWSEFPLALSIGIGMGAPLLVLALLWWMYLMMSLKMQNHAAAVLVPGMRNRSLRVVLAFGAAGTLVLGSLFALVSGSFLYGVVGVALLAGSMLSLGVWPKLPFLFSVVVFWPLVFDGPRPIELIISAPADTLLAAGAALVPLVWYLVLKRLFAGAGHAPGIMPWFSQGGERQTMLLTPYWGARGLRAACRDRDVGRLLAHGLGPNLGTPWMSAGVPFVVLVVALVFAKPAWFTNEGVRIAVQFGAVGMAVMLQTLFALAVERAMYMTQPEQGLLRLAARLPPSGAINSMLGGTLLREFALVWSGSTAGCLLLCYLTGAGPAQVAQLLMVFLLTLAGAGLVLRDYSRPLPRSRGFVAARILYILAVLGTVALGQAILRGAMPHWAAIAIGVAALPVALVLLRWRLRGLKNALCAFPAGRVA